MAAALKFIADWTERVPAIPAMELPDLMISPRIPRAFLNCSAVHLASGAHDAPFDLYIPSGNPLMAKYVSQNATPPFWYCPLSASDPFLFSPSDEVNVLLADTSEADAFPKSAAGRSI